MAAKVVCYFPKLHVHTTLVGIHITFFGLNQCFVEAIVLTALTLDNLVHTFWQYQTMASLSPLYIVLELCSFDMEKALI
jgi:hypothetical protein